MMHTMHGVGLNIFGAGIILTGDSKIGKSELALELLSRGHKFIADDMLNLKVVNKELTIVNPQKNSFMHIRDIGFIDVSSIFGIENTLALSRIDLIVNLTKDMPNESFLEPKDKQIILGHEITQYTISTGINKPLAIIIETITKHYKQLNNGVNSHQDFINYQSQLIRENASCN
jgi:HPr kinase/phosphorylase